MGDEPIYVKEHHIINILSKIEHSIADLRNLTTSIPGQRMLSKRLINTTKLKI